MTRVLRSWVSSFVGLSSILLPGCAALVQEGRVQRQFHEDYRCSSASTAVEPGGYSIAGCGVVAHYRCLSGQHYGVFDSEPSECFLAGTDNTERVEQHAPAEPVSSHRDSKLGVIVRGRADLAAGIQLTVLGAPLKEPHRVVLELHARDRVIAGECSARLYRDGKPLTVLHADSVGPYDLRFIVDVAGFEAAQTATRVAGDGCGIAFELDEAGRQMLGLFAARFREELSKGSPPKS